MINRTEIKDSRNIGYLGRNSMGCDERWYDPNWAICQAFTDEEIDKMTEGELRKLIKLAEVIGEGLY